MTISNELSSEIATALLAKERSAEELSDLKEILFEVHSTLQSLTESAKRERKRVPPAAAATTTEP